VLLLALVFAGAEPDFTVALDPGHGGSNVGAAAAGQYEKQVTLDIARRVERRLAIRHQVRTLLCRRDDTLVPVRARVRCANEAAARLFVSIHANASPEGSSRGSQRGFELYVLPVRDVDTDAAAAAALEKDSAEAAWAAHRVHATAAESVLAAQRIGWRLGDALGVDRDRGIKQAGAQLDVLQGLQMPAVLLEVGFLDHAEEGPYLASEEGRETIATALAKAIEDLRSREIRGRTDPSITARHPAAVRPADRTRQPLRKR
jgi:N-acetylmuramoyl-L-alanine amidase